MKRRRFNDRSVLGYTPAPSPNSIFSVLKSLSTEIPNSFQCFCYLPFLKINSSFLSNFIAWVFPFLAKQQNIRLVHSVNTHSWRRTSRSIIGIGGQGNKYSRFTFPILPPYTLGCANALLILFLVCYCLLILKLKKVYSLFIGFSVFLFNFCSLS